MDKQTRTNTEDATAYDSWKSHESCMLSRRAEKAEENMTSALKNGKGTPVHRKS